MKAKYECDVCGHVHEADEKWKETEDGWKCPTCESDKSYFKITAVVKEKGKETETVDIGIQIPEESPMAEYVQAIAEMAETGKSIIEPMCSTIPTLSWNDILIKGAQVAKIPLNDDVPVNTKTVIGPRALTPLEIETPIYITHMSFGALSREAKIALAKGGALAKTAMCSGEGGILQESLDSAYKYILEFVPNEYSVTEENLQKVDAVEIKIGQSAKPGMGGHLPGEKVTAEIAEIRKLQKGKDITSPAHFQDITSKDELRAKVQWLRQKTGGKPIGIKIAAGNIEDDLEVVVYAEPDFITLDGRPGATGAAPKFVKDATSIPTVPALYRARKYLDAHKIKDISLIITGGLRFSCDFAKALAMGADAIAIGTAALIACGCRQYRICHTGKCPAGLTTQDKNLRKRVNVDKSAKQLANFLNVCTEELRCFARLTGSKDVHNLNMLDLCTTSTEISDYTEIQHVFETLEEVTQWVRLKKI